MATGNLIGETLKQRRNELNLSLKEAETATSIRIAYLQAIEENDVNKLPSSIHAFGFLKQYAAYLGLDGEQMIRENPNYFQKPQSQEFSYGIGTLEMRGNPSSNVKWLPNAIWIAAFFLVLVGAWYLAKYLNVI